MKHTELTSPVSYMNDLYLIVLILLSLSILFGYFYFTQKLKNQEEKFDKILQENDTLTASHEDHLEETSQEHTTEPDISEETEPPEEVTKGEAVLPIFQEPFEETKNITIEDFHNFMGAKILIVEDNKINQKILLSVLKRSGIIMTIANNGQEALDHLYNEERDFDLVLMDISMPLMDGYSATDKIRSDEQFNTLPIVTFTAFAMGKEIQKMYELGINGHMTKPLNNNQLYTVFHTFLSGIESRELPVVNKLNMQGLDVNIGLTLAEGDEIQYQQSLREFIFLYGGLVDSIPYWIEERDYDRIKVNLMKISAKLPTLGADELDEMVARMKKIFIYGNEHRIVEFKESFPQKLEKLIGAMKSYLRDAA